MSLNASHTPDGRGVLIYNGEMILLYTSSVKMSFEGNNHSAFKGKKTGSLYLTTHRIIFMNGSHKEELKSFALPFAMLESVKLEQPLLGANYLKGGIQALQGDNFQGLVDWKMSFPKGGCIEFGQALLRANAMAKNTRFDSAPPMYSAPGAYFAAPANYYMPQGGCYAGFQAPVNVFPEQPPSGGVFVCDKPPPYAGIAPVPAQGPPPGQGWTLPPQPQQYASSVAPPYPGVPSGDLPPAYTPFGAGSSNQQAGPLPEKQPIP